ncbi:DNA (cytosine-5-)-methyltransferase [Flammeovirga yaeyamensis]|uniref:Cytosine-specific methyltransferase n=1 Tax=Flammeovirga yaeyamensis TaxID=367791 RepID=A0AAX1N2G3_9BACT|nr:DNA cytosine methyltransferase [Flammeovirga yaeyamensis]MBB3695931.1 DNA (cytosine-5)-methyltransferase 1 [Flammeovirga yaeyamensis]NMF34619.1 DNA cytosine methyltransferase [Flammeovirga yaeyamensis]QWG00551.1 DNA (cytosine-5-)-methyltransferase [Flammeovirga yaeyamensis]
MNFIDLFAGCGGLSEGFLNADKSNHGLAHVEWELPMVRTLRNRLHKKWNHSSEEARNSVIHFDIQKSEELINGNWTKESILDYGKSNGELPKEKGLKGLVGNKSVDVIIGGPPCQAYSIAGRAQDKDSMKEDYRNYLFESFVKVVKEFTPKLFVFENVPGMLSATPGGKPVTERIFEAFDEIGYSILKPNKLRRAIFSAVDFGVPQKRNRVILVGLNKKWSEENSITLDDVYNSIKDQFSNNKISIKSAIGNEPKHYPLKEPQKFFKRKVSHLPNGLDLENINENQIARFQNDRDISFFREWIKDSWNDKPSKDKIAFYNHKFNKDSKHAKYRNLEWDKPSPTIVAHLNKDGLMFLHPDPEQARSITVREAALLQSFPKDYEFNESMGFNYKMIGNAVPPKMAEGIAKGISKFI